MAKLTLEEMTGLGVVVSGEKMDNGEHRYRLMVGDAGYIWTEPPANEQPKWQNAHYHKGIMETYVVQRGRMAFAEEKDGDRTVRLYGPGDVVSSVPGHAHNVYLFAGSAIHTVKHGESVGNPEKNGADWYPASLEFDAWSKALTEDDIAQHLAKLGGFA